MTSTYAMKCSSTILFIILYMSLSSNLHCSSNLLLSVVQNCWTHVLSEKGDVHADAVGKIKKGKWRLCYHQWTCWISQTEMRIAAAGCHYGVNKHSSSKTISCVSCQDHFLKKVESFCVCGWKMRHANICQRHYGEGECCILITVIQSLGMRKGRLPCQ